MVLEADCGERALEIIEDVDLLVDIFVTDVIMLGMDCPTWVRQALLNQPETQFIFMSGYAQDYFADQQAILCRSGFLPKPFSHSNWPRRCEASWLTAQHYPRLSHRVRSQ